MTRRRTRGETGAPGAASVSLAVAALAIACAYPLLLLFVQSLFPNALGGEWSGFLSPYRRLFSTPDLARMLGHSLSWAAATTAVAWFFGIPCGFLLARCALPGKGFARLTMLAPLMTPPYIAALSYVVLLQPGGFGDRLIGVPEPLRDWFFSFHGVTMAMALASFGYVALGVEAALLRLPPRMEDAALQLGASRPRLWRSILIPLLLPAILNTGLLVFLDALSNFGVPAVLGTRANLALLPAEIYHLLTSWPVDVPVATALSSLLCLLALLSLRISAALTRGSGSAGGRAAGGRLVKLSPARAALAWLWIGGLFVLSTALPYAAMIAMSLVDRWTDGAPAWTLRHYGALFRPASGGRAALLTRLGLAAAAATLCAAGGGFVAYVAARSGRLARRAIEALAILPRALPKIVMTVGLILAWNAPWVRVNLYGTLGMLLLAYVVCYISDALAYAGAALRRMNPRLETAALQLGAGRVAVLARIVAPQLGPALAAAWLTTFIVCVRELVCSILLLPPGVETTATFIFNQFEQGDLSSAMAMATVTIGVTATILFLLQRTPLFRMKGDV